MKKPNNSDNTTYIYMVYLAWASNGVAMLFINIEKNGVKYITLQATFFFTKYL